MFNGLTPHIYTVSYLKEEKRYVLNQGQDKFTLPPVLYGNIQEIAIRVWNTFSISKVSTGILLTGESGSGKSLLAEVICNTALARKIPVIYITAIPVEPELIEILQRLSNVVIYMDEFGKCTRTDMQNTMLSFFSDTSTRKLFILTENQTWMVSNFILNRPGRIRYHIDYQKVPKSILTDYLEKNTKPDEFREEIYKLYNESKIFSFDHLQTLVSEHDRYPNDDLNDLLEILNLGALAKPYLVHVVSILDKTTNKILPRNRYMYNATYEFAEWIRYRYNDLGISIYKDKDEKEPDQRFNGADMIRYYIQYSQVIAVENNFIYEEDNFVFTLTKTRDPQALIEAEGSNKKE